MNKEKTYIEYPIPIKCGLRCPYCFHMPLWEYEERYPNDKHGDKCAFTFDQYRAWRDKHLPDTEILMELHGGEMSFGDNQQLVLDIIDSADKERFQLQTNGLGSSEFYRELVKRKDKIDRIGFTYHRIVIANNHNTIDTFIDNVNLIKDAGIKVYVKELLFLEHKSDILRNKRYWEGMDVEFRIQDFKGAGGLYATESAKYTEADWALVYPEYKHGGECCYCREGYRQIIIRGYDQWSGDVLACWQDHRVIGNIQEGWYEPHEKVLIDPAVPRGRTVVGKGIYRSDYMRDIELNSLEKKYHNLTKESKMLAKLELQKEQLLAKARELQQENTQDRATKEQLLSTVAEVDRRMAERNKTLIAIDGGLQVNAQIVEWAKETSAKVTEPSEEQTATMIDPVS